MSMLGRVMPSRFPFRRPDAVVAPGSSAGIFKGRLVVVFGAGPGTGIFVYSPAPGPGNLVASVAAAAGTDPYGNAYGAGFESYGALGAAAQITSAQIGLFSGLNAVSVINVNGYFLYSPSGGANKLVASVTAAAGTDAYGNAYLAGNTAYGTDGVNYYATSVQGFAGKGPGTVFYTATSEAGPWFQGPALYGGGAGAVRELSASNMQDQVLVRGSTDSVARTNTNNTALVQVTAAYAIQVNEAQLVSIYELFFAGNGQWNATTGQTLTFILIMDGATQLGTFVIGAAGGIPANAHFAVEGRYRISITGTGITGTMNITGSAYLSDTDGNRQSAQSIVGNTSVTGKPIDTTAAHTFSVQCRWGATGTNQTITITDSDWTKKGN